MVLGLLLNQEERVDLILRICWILESGDFLLLQAHDPHSGLAGISSS